MLSPMRYNLYSFSHGGHFLEETRVNSVREATIVAFVMAFRIQPGKKMLAISLHVCNVQFYQKNGHVCN